MCGSDSQTELPLVAAESSGCSCCSTPSTSQSSSAPAGTDHFVDGLTCGHCVETVENAVTALDGVAKASVELVPDGTSRLTVSGSHTEASVRNAVTAAGYSLTIR
ncbi:heavy-metal-associated domain-containing protein [Pseudarthrobacter cellobiosi]|uniref:heavy-metal-associated domain-containing protein n=1 Tax=Pseudarthrobacter cellobiosi TaxID=2953654 RepID=UPI002112E893|nr:heavy-metal-associated domain-containing protein [Pseudarthrobacter sp. HLT1-5]